MPVTPMSFSAFFSALKLGKLHDDGNLVHTGIQPGGQRGFLRDLDGRRDLLRAGLGDVVLAQVGVLVHVQLGVGRVADGKACVGAGQAVLMDVEAVQLLLLGDAQPDRLLMIEKMMNIVISTQAATLTTPSSWMPSLAKPPP